MAPTSKRSDENRARIIKLLGLGTTKTAAAAAVRLSRETLYQWLNDDEEFALDVDRAIQAGITKNVELIQKAAQPRKVKKTRNEYGPPPKDAEGNPIAGAKPVVLAQTVEEYFEEGDWRAAKFLLETKDPENFGKKLDVTSNGQQIKAYAGFDLDEV